MNTLAYLIVSKRPITYFSPSKTTSAPLRNVSSPYSTERENFHFELIYQSKKSLARVGRIHTPHGIIDTPGFVPVATNGTLKSVDNQTTVKTGTQLMFCNTYHLLVHPGPKVIEDAEGLHKFINYPNPIITDSGGFQVFSLSQTELADELKGRTDPKYEPTVLKITEEGVLFKSYRDGSKLLLTPESSIACQKSFGSDIMVPLDELPAYNVSEEALKQSFDRTHRWEMRSLQYHKSNPSKHFHSQAMYSVLHGGVNRALREKSMDILMKQPFDGHAIGGSIGKDRKEMLELLEWMMPQIRERSIHESGTLQPVHLLGIGDVESVDSCIPFGIDTFDSAYPTRAGRHGNLFTRKGTLKIKHAENLNAHEPIDKECHCHTCQHYTRSYLHHLFKTNELSFHILGTIHNIKFMMDKMADIRSKIMHNEI